MVGEINYIFWCMPWWNPLLSIRCVDFNIKQAPWKKKREKLHWNIFVWEFQIYLCKCSRIFLIEWMNSMNFYLCNCKNYRFRFIVFKNWCEQIQSNKKIENIRPSMSMTVYAHVRICPWHHCPCPCKAMSRNIINGHILIIKFYKMLSNIWIPIRTHTHKSYSNNCSPHAK